MAKKKTKKTKTESKRELLERMYSNTLKQSADVLAEAREMSNYYVKAHFMHIPGLFDKEKYAEERLRDALNSNTKYETLRGVLNDLSFELEVLKKEKK